MPQSLHGILARRRFEHFSTIRWVRTCDLSCTEMLGIAALKIRAIPLRRLMAIPTLGDDFARPCI